VKINFYRDEFIIDKNKIIVSSICATTVV